MRRVLKPTGSILVHCDHSAGAYIRAAMDAIFGSDNFRNEIIWHYGKMANATKSFPCNHDTLLRYSKTDDYTFNPIKGAESEYRTRFKRWLTGAKVLYGTVKHSKDKLILGRIKKVKRKHGRDLKDDDVLFDFEVEYKLQSDVIYNSIIKGNSKERTGYPTQKPRCLMRRLIKATSNSGDIVLDPFLGSGTNAIASEELGRKWVGMDLWEEDQKAIDERIALIDSFITEEDGKITLTKSPAQRTDDGEYACPKLPNKFRKQEPPGPKLSRAKIVEMKQREAGGNFCAGCDREFAHISYLELDHNVPRADGGINHHSNRILLCAPCNKRKSHLHTLSWLRQENRRKGFMVDQEVDGKVIDPEPEPDQESDPESDPGSEKPTV